MRRPLAFMLAWTAATAVAVAGSWVGLQPVLAAAAPELPTRLTASQLREAAPILPGPTGSPTPSPPPAPPSPTASPTPSPPPQPSPGPPFPEPPTSSRWEERDDDTFERAFVLRGGEVVVRASRREVKVISHTANPGYEASVTRWTRTSVIVSFQTTDEQLSRLSVMWRNGPYAEVTETV